MTGSRLAPRIVLAAAVGTLVVSIVGFVVTLLLNILVWDAFDAYGEVPIPGVANLHLPEGEVTISFHTQIIGSGGGLPVPNLSLGIDPPAGVPEARIAEDIGATTTVNQDARVQVWVVQIPVDGTYRISTDGDVSAFVSPRLAFGHDSSLGWLPVVFGILMGVSILDLLIALFWLSRVKSRNAAPIDLQDNSDFADFDAQFNSDPLQDASPSEPGRSETGRSSYEPSEAGIRIQQLKTLAALRESGALTEDEFESEKRRLLEGR
jgi:hypothetical protein